MVKVASKGSTAFNSAHFNLLRAKSLHSLVTHFDSKSVTVMGPVPHNAKFKPVSTSSQIFGRRFSQIPDTGNSDHQPFFPIKGHALIGANKERFPPLPSPPPEPVHPLLEILESKSRQKFTVRPMFMSQPQQKRPIKLDLSAHWMPSSKFISEATANTQQSKHISEFKFSSALPSQAKIDLPDLDQHHTDMHLSTSSKNIELGFSSRAQNRIPKKFRLLIGAIKSVEARRNEAADRAFKDTHPDPVPIVEEFLCKAGQTHESKFYSQKLSYMSINTTAAERTVPSQPSKSKIKIKPKHVLMQSSNLPSRRLSGVEGNLQNL